jgi:hypothetical protein
MGYDAAMDDVPMLTPDGPIACCGGPMRYLGGTRGPMAGSIAVVFQCDACGKRAGDIVPLGPRLPDRTRCWSCGAARDASGCTECGLPADALDALAAFVACAAAPALVARRLLEAGYYRTGLAMLHCAVEIKPFDPEVRAMLDPLFAAAG